MSSFYQNRTGYGQFGDYNQNNYYNDYSKTNALHLKYQNMNQTDVPQMKFANRQGSLNLNLIKKLDLKNVIKTNNIIPLEKLSQNLIYSEIKDEDYEDQNIPKLLRTFQYALEYLNEKQSKLEETNNKLNIEYNQLINQSYELEEKLKINKREIAKNSSDKKEREMILITYESVVNFNCNPIENTNIIYNKIDSTYGEYSSNRNIDGRTYPGSMRGKFYCHICNGKYFNTESGLESHMKRRHLAQMRLEAKKEKEAKKEEEIQDFYDKKLDETKNYLQTLIQQKNEIFARTNYEDEINRMKRDNEEKMRNMMEYTKNFPEEMKKIMETYMMQQELNNKNIMNIVNAANNKDRDKNEPQKIIINQPSDEINKLANSIAQFGDILKQQNDKNNDYIHEENRILKNKIEILESQSKIINPNQIYSFNQSERTYNNQNILIPENNNVNNMKRDNNIPNNNIPNNYNNSSQQNNIINSNNIQNPEKSSNNFSNNSNIIISQIPKKDREKINIQREKKNEQEEQDPNEEDKKKIKIIISQSINDPNDNLDENNPYKRQNNQNNENAFSNTGDNFKSSLIKIQQEDNPYLKDKNKDKDNFNKTAPSVFKKRNYKPIEIKKDMAHSGSMKEFNIFYAKFMNRDQPIYQPILDNEKPNPKEYLKEIIPPDKRNEDSDNNYEKLIEERTKKVLNNYENRDKQELMEEIEKTMNNINELTRKNEVSQFYYEIAQKAFDLKLLEEDKKMMKTAYDNNGMLKRSRSSSRAKITIQQSENLFNN